MNGEVAIIVPIKFNSTRVKRKNLRLINGIPLYHHIFSQLIQLDRNWDIFIYSSNIFCAGSLDERIKYLPRPRYLDSDAIQANELFKYAANLLPHRVQSIVHPTSPFLTEHTIQTCIDAVVQGGYDSSFSAEEIKSYAWYEGKPLNYDPNKMVQTQQLVPIVVENSGIYVYLKENYIKNGTRVGKNPYVKIVMKKEAIDIDTEEDLEQAKMVASELSFEGEDVYCDSDICLKGFPLIEHVVFDFDGVIADTLMIMKKSWGEVESNYKGRVHIPTFEKYEEHLGKPFKEILSAIGIDKTLWNNIYEIYFKASEKQAKEVGLCNGVEKLINYLLCEKKSLSIYTSKPKKVLENIDAYQAIKKSFKFILTSDTLPEGMKGKPTGDGLKYICKKTGSEISKSLYIGDSCSDAVEAENANMLFIRACWARLNDEKYLPNEIIAFLPEQIYEIMSK